MEKLVNYFKKLMTGKLTRIEYFKKFVLALLILIIPSSLIGALSSTIEVNSSFVTLFSVASILMTISQLIVVVIVTPYIFAIALKRLKDIMGTRSHSEVNTVFIVLTLVGFVIPLIGFVNAGIYLFAPSNFSEMTFYKNNLQAPIENLTNFALSIVKKQTN